MSETNAVAAKAAPKLKVGQAWLAGQIDSARQYEAQGRKQVETRVVLPAPDQYTAPSYIAVTSNARLGQVGDAVELIVELSGYRDSYKTREGDTVQTARNVLRAVE